MLKRGDEIVPDLIKVVEAERGWPLIHAALLLCELRAESALPALQRAISVPWGHDLADWLADDALEKFGLPALDMLEAIAADKTVDWYPRGGILEKAGAPGVSLQAQPTTKKIKRHAGHGKR